MALTTTNDTGSRNPRLTSAEKLAGRVCKECCKRIANGPVYTKTSKNFPANTTNLKCGTACTYSGKGSSSCEFCADQKRSGCGPVDARLNDALVTLINSYQAFAALDDDDEEDKEEAKEKLKRFQKKFNRSLTDIGKEQRGTSAKSSNKRKRAPSGGDFEGAIAVLDRLAAAAEAIAKKIAPKEFKEASKVKQVQISDSEVD